MSTFDNFDKKILHTKNNNPEAALWKAVIMQAVLDSMTNSKRASEILARKTAMEWLNTKNTNFVKVCGYADLDPSWVVAKIHYALKNPKTWRRECDLKGYFKNSKHLKSSSPNLKQHKMK